MRSLGCATCTRRGHCIEDPDQCDDYEPDVESLSHSLVKQTVLDASIRFKRVCVERDGDALCIRVSVDEAPDPDERRAFNEIVATALTVMNHDVMCLADGTRMLLTFEEM